MNKNFDEIDKMFDELQKANDETVEAFKSKLKDQDDLTINNRQARASIVVKRPIISDNITIDLKSRFEYFLYLIQNCNYGESYNKEYVKGHEEALKKYYNAAMINALNLVVVEGELNDELEHFQHVSKNTINLKGYYDGLIYVNKALQKSKQMMSKKINDILRKELY